MSEADSLDPRVIDTIIAEAGNNVAGQRAVAAAIINRAKAQGKTPLQIVQQSGQFEGYSNPGSASVKAQKIASVRQNATKAFNDILTGAVADPLKGGKNFRSDAAANGLHAPHGTVSIGGNTFALGNAPSSAVAAIDAVAPVPRSIPTSLSAYADTPAVALPPLPVPRPSNPEGIRSVEINPDGTLKQPAVFPSRSDTLLPFAGGLTAQPQGAGDSWGPESGHWGPANFANAFPMPAPRAPSEALTSRSVHTVQIDPFTGNPVGSNTPFVSADHPLSNAISPKTIFYNSTAGNVALPKGVVPASVTRDLASIAGSQMNRSGSPDDRQAPAPQIAPTPMPGRPAFNTPYIPGPNGSNIANKDTSSLQPSTPLAFGSPVQSAPAVQAITKQIVNPDYTKWVASNTQPLKAGQAYTATGNVVTQAQQNAFGGLSSIPVPPPSIPIRTPAPSKHITITVPGGAPQVPLPRPRPATPAPVSDGLLSLIGQGLGSIFGGNSPHVVAPPVGGNPNITYGPIVAAGNFAPDSPNASFEKQNGMGSVTNSMAASSRWNTGY